MVATAGVVTVMHQRGTAGVAASSTRSSSSSSSSTNRVFHSSSTTTTTTTNSSSSSSSSNLVEEEPILEMLDLDILDADYDLDSDTDTDTDTGGDDGHNKQRWRRKRHWKRRKNSRPLLVAFLSRLYHLTMNHVINYVTDASSRYQQQQQQQHNRLGNSSSNNIMKKKTVKKITTILGMSLFMGLFIILSLTSQQLHMQIRRQQMEASISSSSSSSSFLTTTGQEDAEYGPTDNGWSTSLTRTGVVATILGSSSFDAAIPKILTSIYSSGTSSSSSGHGRSLLRKSSQSSTPPKSSGTLSSSTTTATSATSNSVSSSGSSFSSSSRTFFNRRRLNNNKSKKNRSYIDERGLRYLALGGQAFVAMGESSTSSSDHSNNSSKKNHKEGSYPALLSRNVRTVSPGGGNEIADDNDDDDDDNPTLASLCTQSMIGDENIYDVITVQYQTAHATKDDASSSSSSLSAVGLLLERLRQRFPDSTIVFVDVWSPLEVYYYDDDEQRHPTNKVSFEQWRSKIIQEDDDGGSSSLSKRLKDHEWLLDDEDEARRSEMEGIVEAIGGILYRLPRSSTNDSDNSSSNDIIQTIMDWFVEHPTTNTNNIDNGNDKKTDGMTKYSLSPKAHTFIASDLESIIKRSIEMTPAYRKPWSSKDTDAIAASTTTGDGSSSSSPRVGTWGSGDSCQLWYEAGNVIPSQFSQGLTFVELAAPSFDSKRRSNNRGSSRRALSSSSSPSSSELIRSQRYALEVTSASDEDQDGNDAFSSSYLQVHNPFDEDRMLYLTYLTTSATSSSRKVYPRTKIQLRHGTSSTASGTVVLDPSHDDNSDDHHHTRTSAVGTVPAGQSSTIYFTPLEEYTESSFRVVGASFLAKEKLSHRISSDFHLSPYGITMKFDDTQDDDETQN